VQCAHEPGHSLGGALATLAAFDIQSRFHFKHCDVVTFGAPRVGNTAFARRARMHATAAHLPIAARQLIN
jgi:predicted lipase